MCPRRTTDSGCLVGGEGRWWRLQWLRLRWRRRGRCAVVACIPQETAADSGRWLTTRVAAGESEDAATVAPAPFTRERASSKDARVDSSDFSPHTPAQCVEHFGTACCHLTRDERREQKPAQLMPRELLSRVTWVGRALSCPTPEPGDKQRQPSQFTTCPARRVVV